MASVSLMPTTAYQTDDFQYVISSTLGIFYMLSFLYPVSRIIRSLVLEKETRIREGFRDLKFSSLKFCYCIWCCRHENDGLVRHGVQPILADHNLHSDDHSGDPDHISDLVFGVRVQQQVFRFHLLWSFQSGCYKHVRAEYSHSYSLALYWRNNQFTWI